MNSIGRLVDLLVALLWSGRDITGESLPRCCWKCHRPANYHSVQNDYLPFFSEGLFTE